MEVEIKNIRLLYREQSISEDFFLYEKAPDDEEKVLIETIINGHKFSYKSENFFYALQALRKELEIKNIQIICNGAAKTIYPSPMQMSMGNGRIAYKLSMGQQAKSSDLVDIFDCDEELDFVNLDEQSKYYSEWLRSVMGCRKNT